MASNFTSGKFQAIGPIVSGGIGPLPGALLYTMAAGTSFPGGALATYTDQAGLSPNRNPVQCDANGQASVWLGASAYRMILKTALGVTVWDVDNVLTEAGFTAAGTGAVLRTVQSKLRDTSSAKDYGATGDGVTDDTAALQKWLTAGGGFLPAGTYIVSTGLTVPAMSYILGAGPKTSILFASTSFNGNLLTIDSDDASVCNVGFSAGSARSAGSFIRIAQSHRSILIEDIWMLNAYRGILHDGPAVIVSINRVEMLGVTATTGIGIDILDGNDTYISNTVITSSSPQCAAGVRIVKSGAVWMDTVDCISTGVGLQVSPGAGQAVTWCFFNACAFDTCNGSAINITATNTGTIRSLNFVDCWGSTSAVGVSVSKPNTAIIDGLHFTSCRFFNNQYQGVTLADATSFFFDSCAISGNSIAASGAYGGIEIGAGLANFGIRNCHIGQSYGFTNIQGWGIKLGAGCDGYTIIGNHILNNTVAGLSDASITTSNYRTISHNVGFFSERQGSGTVAVAATTAVITHGLGFTPEAGDIVITLGSDLASSSVTRLWISAYSSTTFTVTTNTAAVSAAVSFNWQARLK